METASNVVIEGCAGTGKSFLACCLAKQACRMRRSARYVRLRPAHGARRARSHRAVGREDIEEIRAVRAPAPGRVAHGRRRRHDINFLFELIERRYAAKSTVICTQHTPAEWHGRLGGGVQADVMVDRLVHGAIRIDLGDVNVRKLLAERK